MTSGTFTDETLNGAFARVKAKFRNRPELIKAFADVRKAITQAVRSCADNIIATVYVDEVLDDPIITTVGKGENKLLITIDSENGIDFTWTEETVAKAFWDGWGYGQDIAKKIVAAIATFTGALLAIAFE